MSKLISVIIPVYNTEKYLCKCLDSVCGQTLQDIEIICINDCSTDGSLEILQEYAALDKRVRVFNNRQNMQVGMSRNVGLQNAHGEYIYFIDSDDYLDRDYLQQMYDCAIRQETDIVINTNILKEKGSTVERYVHPSMPFVPEEGCYLDNAVAIEKCWWSVLIKLFKKQLFEKSNINFEKIDFGEDMVFSYLSGIYAQKIYVFAGSAFHCVVREDGLSETNDKNNKRDLKTMMAYDIIYDYLIEHDWLKINRAKIFNVFPFYKVDTQEKFSLYKGYFGKVQNYLREHREQYNAMDWFFAESILSSKDFDDYRSKYPASVALGFLKSKKRK